MKGKIIFLGLCVLFTSQIMSAQNKNAPQSIISTTAVIRKYYTQDELKGMQKGELLELYIERIRVLVKTLPYIALATKPGLTMYDLGIPMDNDKKKLQDGQTEATNNFLENTMEYQKRFVPYADTENLIAAILFYESTVKSLHLFNEYK
ncbi:hypothetical protein [Flavobacterium crassostreae]|uniref:Uncharacterized protein n=1 Tax=Flavobacterium crassostreae TaxID=1763534 RepID=A0A1B9E5N8_9FLAO|nr:hypothetical protein [Flavobacterium crassostreae]OCB77178.1 hypothetical protein LPBF_04010 [Flavobacterium crassostreae]